MFAIGMCEFEITRVSFLARVCSGALGHAQLPGWQGGKVPIRAEDTPQVFISFQLSHYILSSSEAISLNSLIQSGTTFGGLWHSEVASRGVQHIRGEQP